MARRRRRRRRVQHPGVYVEEVPSASRPIAGVGTATAAFVGTLGSLPRRHLLLAGALVLGLVAVTAAVAASTLRRTASSFG